MKSKLIVISCLFGVILCSGCWPFGSDSPPPGYRAITLQVDQGISHKISAGLDTELLNSSPGAVGSRYAWSFYTGWPSYSADSPADMILPAKYVAVFKNTPCVGQPFATETIYPHETNYYECVQVRFYAGYVSPEFVNFYQPPTYFSLINAGLSNAGGGPVAVVFDQFGNPQQEVTPYYVSPDGMYAEFGTQPLSSLDSGPYDVVIYNRDAAGTYQYLGWNTINVTARDPSCPPDPRMECQPEL